MLEKKIKKINIAVDYKSNKFVLSIESDLFEQHTFNFKLKERVNNRSNNFLIYVVENQEYLCNISLCGGKISLNMLEKNSEHLKISNVFATTLEAKYISADINGKDIVKYQYSFE